MNGQLKGQMDIFELLTDSDESLEVNSDAA